MALQGKKNQIFRVIAALQPTEKAYIRKFAFKTEKAGTLSFALFDLMEKALRKEIEPQEADILKAFSKLHPEAEYVKVKARLLEIIGDALVEYDRKSSNASELFDLCLLAESYLKRKLVQDAVQVLLKAEKFAAGLDETELLIRILSHRMAAEAYNEQFNRESLEPSHWEPVFEHIALLQRKTRVRESAQRMHRFQKHIGLPRSEADRNLLAEIAATEGLQYPLEQLDLTSAIDQTLTRCILFFTYNEFNKVIEACAQFLVTEPLPSKSNKTLQTRMIALYDSYMQACLLNEQSEAFEKAYLSFANFESSHTEVLQLKAGVDLYVRAVSAYYFRRFGQFVDLNREFEKQAKNELLPNYRKVSLAYFLALGLFSNAQWQEATKRIHWIYQQNDFSIRYDIDVALRLMKLIILAEQGDWFHLDYSLRNLSESLHNRERKFEIERLLLRFLKKLLSNPSLFKHRPTLLELNSRLREVVEIHPNEAQFIRAFNAIEWVEGKLGNLES